MARIRLDGAWYEWNDTTISGRRLKQMFNVDAGRDIMIVTKHIRNGTIMPDDKEIPIDADSIVQATTFPKGAVYGTDVANLSASSLKNLSEREKFILAQVFHVSERYYFRNKNALMLSRNCDFLVIRDFPLPPSGDWMTRNATICMYFPKNYPRQAPVGFFVDERLQHKGTGEDHLLKGTAVYHEPDTFYKKHGLHRKGYGFYCWHIEKNWKPDLTDPLKPDNLDSFLKLAYFAFDSRSVKGLYKLEEII